MSLKDYYIQEKTSHVRLRESICQRLDISRETFYNRMKDDNWSTIEKEAIAKLICKNIDELFPENK